MIDFSKNPSISMCIKNHVESNCSNSSFSSRPTDKKRVLQLRQRNSISVSEFVYPQSSIKTTPTIINCNYVLELTALKNRQPSNSNNNNSNNNSRITTTKQQNLQLTVHKNSNNKHNTTTRSTGKGISQNNNRNSETRANKTANRPMTASNFSFDPMCQPFTIDNQDKNNYQYCFTNNPSSNNNPECVSSTSLKSHLVSSPCKQNFEITHKLQCKDKKNQITNMYMSFGICLDPPSCSQSPRNIDTIKKSTAIQDYPSLMKVSSFVDSFSASKTSYYTNSHAKPVINGESQSADISRVMRIALVDWMMQLCQELHIPREVLHKSIAYVDAYAAKSKVEKKNYQLTGLAALTVACRLEMQHSPSLAQFMESIQGLNSKEELIRLQEDIMVTLKYKLNPPTIFSTFLKYLNEFRTFSKEQYMAVDIQQRMSAALILIDALLMAIPNNQCILKNEGQQEWRKVWGIIKASREQAINIGIFYVMFRNHKASLRYDLEFQDFLKHMQVEVELQDFERIFQYIENVCLGIEGCSFEPQSLHIQGYSELLKHLIIKLSFL